MDRNRVTVRYAKALIELASEQNVLNEVSNDFSVLAEAIKQYEGFEQYISNPGFSSSEKFGKVESIFSESFNALSIKFIQLVFNNNREEYLKDLCRNIVAMAMEIRGIISANLTTAKKLDSTLIEKLKKIFESEIKADLQLSTEINEELIGGFVFTIDGQQYDASVASKINAIKKQLQL